MRLINIKTLDLEDFIGDQTPEYAILSHTWGSEEVSFQEYSWFREHERELVEDPDVWSDLSPKQTRRLENKLVSIWSKAGVVKIRRCAKAVNDHNR